MALRIVSLLLFALMAGPMSLSARAVARPENRVWGFSEKPSVFASQENANPIGTPSENGGCGYDFAPGVHKYLYANVNPINGIDPSGHSMVDILCACYIAAQGFAMDAVAVYTAYTEAENVVDAVQIAAVLASGGSVPYAKIVALSVNFVPFGKVLNKIGAEKVLGTVGQGLLKQVYRITGKSQAIGDIGALMAIYQQGFKRIGFKPAYHGFDDVVKDAEGNFIVVEAKGGASQLAKTKYGQQMSQKWIRRKIEQLKKKGQNELADELDQAIVDGKLKGMVVTTKPGASGVISPVAELKDWSQIGLATWK